MHAVLSAAIPIFALIFTGYLCGRFGVLPPAATDSLNRFAINLALPALMFLAMSRVMPGEAAQVGFALAFAGGVAITFALGFALSRWRGHRVATTSIEALDASYSNVSFMGIPLCLLVFGAGNLPAAVIATLCTASVLFLGAITIIEIDLHRRRQFVADSAQGRTCADLKPAAVGSACRARGGPVRTRVA